MAVNAAYLNAIGDHGGTLITHIGLVDETDTEITGGDPAYARQAASWDTAVDGQIDLSADLTFDIPEGTTVAGWQGYSASTGGTAYGIVNLTNEAFANQGTYTLQASGTFINHSAS